MMEQVLVLGGTGFLGRAFCAQWNTAHGGGGPPRLTVATRRVMRGRDETALPTIDVVEADVHDDAALAQLVRGHDAVVNLIAILHGSREAFEKVHVALPRRLAAACAQAGVRRLVHVSALGVVDGDPQAAPSDYLRTKSAGEQVLRASTLDLTVLRPSVMFGAEDRFLNMFAHLEALLPLVPLAGAHSRYQPVWVDDTAQAIVRCLERRDTIGQVYECAGPEVFTLEELVRAAGRWSGHERPVVPLPDTLARLQAMVMEALPGTPLMSRDNLDSMKVDNVATGRWPTLEALGIEPTAVDAVAPQYLAAGAPSRLDHWRAGAGRA